MRFLRVLRRMWLAGVVALFAFTAGFSLPGTARAGGPAVGYDDFAIEQDRHLQLESVFVKQHVVGAVLVAPSIGARCGRPRGPAGRGELVRRRHRSSAIGRGLPQPAAPTRKAGPLTPEVLATIAKRPIERVPNPIALADALFQAGDTSVDTIDTVDAAIDTLSGLRADFGTVQNRLESTIRNISMTAENRSIRSLIGSRISPTARTTPTPPGSSATSVPWAAEMTPFSVRATAKVTSAFFNAFSAWASDARSIWPVRAPTTARTMTAAICAALSSSPASSRAAATWMPLQIFFWTMRGS